MIAPLLSTKVHGVIDYLTAPLLLAAPKALSLEDAGAARRLPRMTGALLALQSTMTDYELGLVKAIPIRAHLALDALSGVALAGGPWLTGETKKGVKHWAPHVAIGAGEIAVALLTRPGPEPEPEPTGWKGVVAKLAGRKAAR